MSRFPRLAVILLFLPLAAPAQEETQTPRPFFVHLGADKVDPGAGSFAPVAEAGVPILRWGLTCLGVFGGGTQWRRGSFSAGSVRPGDLLDKTAGWAGVYGGGAFWTVGLAGEFARQQVYVAPSPADNFYNGITQNRTGAGVFVGLHGQSGFGAFVRAGTQSGFGCGLSFHF
jgi:hypothetical protein